MCHMTETAQSPTSDDLIPTAEACRILDRDRSVLSRWVTAGRIKPALRAPGLRGAMMFRRVEVEALAAELAEASR